MPTTTTDWIQAGAAIASVFVALMAVVVAWLARGIAKDANEISAGASNTAKDALVAARRQTALAAVPFLTVARPELRANGDFVLKITNGGPTVAFGIIATIAVAASRSVDNIDASTARSSGREPALRPDSAEPLYRSIPAADGTVMVNPNLRPIAEWTYVRLEYLSPLGGSVRQEYLWDGRTKWRLHRVRIDPGTQAGDPVQFDIALGPGDDSDTQGQQPQVFLG